MKTTAFELFDDDLAKLKHAFPTTEEPFFENIKNLSHKILQTGRGPEWLTHLENLPSFIAQDVFLDQSEIGAKGSFGSFENAQVAEEALKGLRPWRKGPFIFGDLKIDTEWQSWKKWDRLKEVIRPLNGKKVLDIGCNSGYYLFRMCAQNPEIVVGVDPFSLYFAQYQVVKNILEQGQNSSQNSSQNSFKMASCMLPVGVEDVYPLGRVFDTVFCMGILYHRKSPLEFIREMQNLLKKGGELILETITVPGEESICLCPPDRYQSMKNVYFLPTVSCLVNWLENYGFCDVRVMSTEKTTFEEQRATEWSYGDSLQGGIDPEDHSKTIEGHPAPERTLIIATAK
jgi:tRNA (mo5U34)-methyltransferase